MSAAVPTASEERWLALAARYRALRAAALQPALAGRWKCATPLTRCLFFALGIVAAVMSYAVANLLNLPAWEVLCGLALIAAAEWLIATRHLFASGIEEALWSAGAVGIAFKLWDVLPGLHNNTSGLLLVAAALLIAGFRLLNPLLTTAGAIMVSIALTLRTGWLWTSNSNLTATAFCFSIGFLALSLGARHYARPAHDRMLDWLVVTMPAVGYLWTLWNRSSSFKFEMLREPHFATLLPLLLPLTLGALALATGLRRRTHAPLISALLCVVCLAVELRAVTGMSLQWRLIVWGTVGLFAAIAVEHWLRTPRNGITSQDVEDSSDALNLIPLAGAAAMTPPAAGPAVQPGVQGQGGGFSGGGASGKF